MTWVLGTKPPEPEIAVHLAGGSTDSGVEEVSTGHTSMAPFRLLRDAVGGGGAVDGSAPITESQPVRFIGGLEGRLLTLSTFQPTDECYGQATTKG